MSITSSGSRGTWPLLILLAACSSENPNGAMVLTAPSGGGMAGSNQTIPAGGGAASLGGGAVSTGGDAGEVASSSGVTANTAGAAANTDGAGGTASIVTPVMGPDGFPAGCVEVPTFPAGDVGRATVSLSLLMGDAPLVFGEPNALAEGGTVLPTNVRFYLSQFAFLRGGERVPALPVDALGVPLPYGVKLINAEEPGPQEMFLAAAPGEYDGLSVLLGLSEGCNTFQAQNSPLDDASQLKWPHFQGFLFLRFEGKMSPDAVNPPPNMIHMGRAGAQGFAPILEVATALTLGANTPPLSIGFDVGAALQASAMPIDPPAPPGMVGETLAGEHLRRNAPLVDILVLPGVQ